MNKGFIQQTANDYDISYEIVEEIYKKYPNPNEFYEKLEEYIILKANN